MTIVYDQPPPTGAIRQGSIIGPIWEHRAVYPPSEIRRGSAVSLRSLGHSLVIVLSPDCDLLWDFEMRFDADPQGDDARLDADVHPSAVTHVLLCELFGHDEIRQRFRGAADLWRRVENNQDARYHHLAASPVGAGSKLELHDLYIDFKRVFSISTDRLYEGLLSEAISRIATLREGLMHDLIHRFYGFLSRVAVEE